MTLTAYENTRYDTRNHSNNMGANYSLHTVVILWTIASRSLQFLLAADRLNITTIMWVATDLVSRTKMNTMTRMADCYIVVQPHIQKLTEFASHFSK